MAGTFHSTPNSSFAICFSSKKAGRYSSARALENERIISNMAVIDRKVMLNFLPYSPAGDYWGIRYHCFSCYGLRLLKIVPPIGIFINSNDILYAIVSPLSRRFGVAEFRIKPYHTYLVAVNDLVELQPLHLFFSHPPIIL